MNKRFFTATFFCAFVGLASAQFIADDPDWKESEVPAPPTLDLKRLVPVDVSIRSQLKWGIDPDSIKIMPEGIVRYVVVAQSQSGVVNAMYEGIRCNKAEFRSYARYNVSSGWIKSSSAEWRSLRETGASSHPSWLARQGLCDGAAPPSSVQTAIRHLRAGSVIETR